MYSRGVRRCLVKELQRLSKRQIGIRSPDRGCLEGGELFIDDHRRCPGGTREGSVFRVGDEGDLSRLSLLDPGYTGDLAIGAFEPRSEPRSDLAQSHGE